MADVDYKLEIETRRIKSVPVILKEAQEMCATMHEAEQICEHLLQRLTVVAFAALRLPVKLPDEVVNLALAVLYGFRRFLQAHSGKPAIRRLVVNSSLIVRRCMDFHRKIGELLPTLNLPQVDWITHDWEQPFDVAREKQRVQLMMLMSEDTSVVSEAVADLQVRTELLLLLMYECNESQDACFQPEVDVAKRILNLILSLPQSIVPVLPVWFLPLYELQYARTPLRTGVHGPEHRGTHKGSSVLLKFVQLETQADRVAFEEIAALWFEIDHPHVVRLVGACHVGEVSYFVCEDTRSVPLLKHLSIQENRYHTWTRLHEVSLGFLSLRDQVVSKNNLQCGSITVTADGSARLTDFVKKPSVTIVDSGAEASCEYRTSATTMASEAFESDNYQLGMCILEATTLDSS